MNILNILLFQSVDLTLSLSNIIFALTPILLLIFLMGILKLSGDKSAVLTLITTVIFSFFIFNFPMNDIGITTIYGITKAFFPILFIIIMAIFSYNVLMHTQYMEVIKQQFVSISSDRSIQVLLLTWGFGGLLEGMAGFGTAVAIPAAILIGLGFPPVFSAVVSLIANSVATAFGSVGVPVFVLAEQTGIQDIQTLSSQVIIQLSPLMFIIPFILLCLTEFTMKKLPQYLILSLLVGGVSLLGQYVAAKYMGAETPAILGSIASILTIIIYARITNRKEKSEKEKIKKIELLKAWSVYGSILILIILVSPILPLRSILTSLCSTSLTFTIESVGTKTITIYWLVDTAVLLFVGSMIGATIQGAKWKNLFKILGKVIISQQKTIITVCSLIVLSSIMDFSGMIGVVGLALAQVTGTFYPLFAPTVGCLGTFLTGSDTSSNILFGKLQVSVSHATGADPSWLAAANTAGATGGKIISPQSIAIATSASKQQGQEGNIMKRAMPYALLYIIVVGLMVYFIPKI
ncbi:MAG: L-lactate permease [Bacteroidales bacterium]|nr:L-lactate permease [Bacteroidales bacterium]